MKFDNVLGNPPFQHDSKSKGNKLWPKFVFKSFDLATENGNVSLITPTTWLSGGSNTPEGKGVLDDCLKIKKVSFIDIYNVSSHFNEGSTFGYFVSQNTSPEQKDNTTVIMADGNVEDIKLSDYDFLHQKITKTMLSIFKKTFFNGVPFNVESFDRSLDSNIINVSKEYTETRKVKHWFLGGNNSEQIHHVYLDRDISPKLSGKNKVLFRIADGNKWQPFIDVQGVSVAAQGFAVFIDSDVTVENALSVFNSELYAFLLIGLRSSSFLKTNMVKSIPSIPLTKKWSNEEIYNNFNISPEEQTFIKETLTKMGGYTPTPE